MGSDLAAMQAPEFITTLARGIQWAAGRDVTLPPNLALPQPNADAVRTLLITGGHDHETTFYSIFDGYKDLTWTPVSLFLDHGVSKGFSRQVRRPDPL